MLIDWFTVCAQALNFAVLVWLMRRFLYRPILKVVEARDGRIAGELAGAKRKQHEAQQVLEEFQEKSKALDEERETLLRDAKAQAAAERMRLIEAAREAAAALGEKRGRALDLAADNLEQSIAERTQLEVFAIARKTLTDLASASLEGQAIEVFMHRLRELDTPTRTSLSDALRAAPDAALVRSAFLLPDAQRALIRRAIKESLQVDAELRFETAPALVSGVELSASGQKLAWSIDDYLQALSESVRALVDGGRNRDRAAHTAREATEAALPHGA